jgi:UTP-glucose-1-phosphate uridylyltransferase
MISKMNEGAGDGIIAAADILQGERYDAASGDDIITKTGTYTCL